MITLEAKFFPSWFEDSGQILYVPRHPDVEVYVAANDCRTVVWNWNDAFDVPDPSALILELFKSGKTVTLVFANSVGRYVVGSIKLEATFH